MIARQPLSLKQLGIIALLLLLQLFIRIHNAEVQDVFIDEGYHVTRGAIIWDFDQHPGRFANGKLLLYYWLGIFETDPLISLPISRIVIGLFSLVNGAALYLLGRYLHSYLAGILALGIYAVLPFAFFFERMVLADPFASVFVSLTVWRSLVFIRRPAWREGAILGILLALATLAKLTMILIPFLPAVGSIIYSSDWRDWRKTYLPSLVVAAVVFILFWLPIVIPAVMALNTENQFIIVNPENLQQLSESEPGEKLAEILPELTAYTTPWVMAAAGLALFYLSFHPKTRKLGLFFVCWLLLLTFLSIVAAKVIRARYLMPVSSIIALVSALALARLWYESHRLIRSGAIVAAVVWLVTFALPFAHTAVTHPDELPLGSGEWNRYMSGKLSGEALRKAADTLNTSDPQAAHIYSTWGTCQLLYFYVDQEVTCLPVNVSMRTSLEDHFSEEIAPGDVAYVVLNGYSPLTDMRGYRWKFVAGYKRPNIDRPVEVWRVQKLFSGQLQSTEASSAARRGKLGK